MSNCNQLEDFIARCPGGKTCVPKSECPFRTVIITPEMGSDAEGEPFAPYNGAYQNALVKYEVNGNVYIYSADGIPVPMPSNSGISLDFNYLSNRPKYAGTTMSGTTDIPNVTAAVAAEADARIAADTALNTAKENVVPMGTTDQYYRGDKTWATFNKGLVGLGNVDNTSDSTKKNNFRGSILSGDNGFVVGGDVKSALDLKANSSDVKNGALTINNNGTTLGTFTANQDTNVNVNIETITATASGTAGVKKLKDSYGTEFYPQIDKTAISGFSVTSGDIANNAVINTKIDYATFEYQKYPTVADYTTTTTDHETYTHTIVQDGLFNIIFSVNFSNQSSSSEVSGRCDIWKGGTGTGTLLGTFWQEVNKWGIGNYQTCEKQVLVRLSAGDIISASTKSFGGDLETTGTSFSVIRVL